LVARGSIPEKEKEKRGKISRRFYLKSARRRRGKKRSFAGTWYREAMEKRVWRKKKGARWGEELPKSTCKLTENFHGAKSERMLRGGPSRRRFTSFTGPNEKGTKRSPTRGLVRNYEKKQKEGGAVLIGFQVEERVDIRIVRVHQQKGQHLGRGKEWI